MIKGNNLILSKIKPFTNLGVKIIRQEIPKTISTSGRAVQKPLNSFKSTEQIIFSIDIKEASKDVALKNIQRNPTR